MPATVKRKLYGLTLSPREHFSPKVPMGAPTAAERAEALRVVRLVIEQHRQVLKALKER